MRANDRLVLDALHQQGPLSGPEITLATGVLSSTVHAAINRLTLAGLVEVSGLMPSRSVPRKMYAPRLIGPVLPVPKPRTMSKPYPKQAPPPKPIAPRLTPAIQAQQRQWLDAPLQISNTDPWGRTPTTKGAL